MTEVTNPAEAFEGCHGYKADGKLYLYTDGAMGMLSQEQIPRCDRIYLNNAAPGPRVFDSVEEARAAETMSDEALIEKVAEKERETTRKEVRKAFAQCAREHEGLPTPVFQRRVGECVDRAIPGVGKY